MAGPWDKYAAPQSKMPWEKYGKQEPDTVYSGTILPLSKDSEGKVHFDPNAGIIGTLKRAIMAPGDAMSGKLPVVDPETGHVTDEAIQRANEMATVVSPVNPAVRAGDAAIPGVSNAMRPAKVEPPSAEMLKNTASLGYDTARDMGVHYSSDSVRALAANTRMGLEQDGILETLAPKSFAILKSLENPPEQSTAPLFGVEAARRALRNAAKDFNNPTEQLAAKRIIDGLDQFTESPDPASVVAGPAATAGQIQADARANYAAGKRSDRIQGVDEAADLRASSANSGQNIGNSIRQRVASLLLDPKKRAGYSKEEIAALEEVARGTAGRNTLRYVSNLLGGGGGLGAAVVGGVGGIAGGYAGGLYGMGVGLGLPVLGAIAKKSENALTRRSLTRADELVRQRSPLYEYMQQSAGTTVTDPALRSALTRALLLQKQQQQNDLNNGITY